LGSVVLVLMKIAMGVQSVSKGCSWFVIDAQWFDGEGMTLFTGAQGLIIKLHVRSARRVKRISLAMVFVCVNGRCWSFLVFGNSTESNFQIKDWVHM
jgi:hypothetical protein